MSLELTAPRTRAVRTPRVEIRGPEWQPPQLYNREWPGQTVDLGGMLPGKRSRFVAAFVVAALAGCGPSGSANPDAGGNAGASGHGGGGGGNGGGTPRGVGPRDGKGGLPTPTPAGGPPVG